MGQLTSNGRSIVRIVFLGVAGLLAAGHDDVGIADHDGLGAEHDGFQTRTAHLVYCQSFHVVGKSSLKQCLPGRILA